jgi:hypothetical protein
MITQAGLIHPDIDPGNWRRFQRVFLKKPRTKLANWFRRSTPGEIMRAGVS